MFSFNKFFNEYYGEDLLKTRINIANKKINKKNIFFKTSDLNNGLDYKEKMDTITIIATLEYIIEPIRAIEEFNRNLNVGVYLIIEVPNTAYILNRVRSFFGKLPRPPIAIGWEGGRLHNFTVNSLKKVLESRGFKIEKIVIF